VAGSEHQSIIIIRYVQKVKPAKGVDADVKVVERLHAVLGRRAQATVSRVQLANELLELARARELLHIRNQRLELHRVSGWLIWSDLNDRVPANANMESDTCRTKASTHEASVGRSAKQVV
jgi:hypothetical protein